MSRMPLVQNLIVMNSGHKLSTFQIPDSVKVYGMNEVEEIGAQPEHSKY